MNIRPDQTHRQFVSFTCYRILPEWRRLPLHEREEQRREFAETVRKWNVPDTMRVLTYSLVGLRGEVDLMLWRICYSISCLQEMASDVLRTRLAGYLESPYSFVGMTRRSQYLINEHENQPVLRGVMRPGGAKYLLVYPLVRTRAWYLLPFEDRQRMIRELVEMNHDFPRCHLNVIYSFGLDDQDFVIAIETDHPEDLLDHMMRLRETESSAYTQRDTPVLLSARASIEEMLETIG